MEIIPAILVKDVPELKSQLTILSSYFTHFQIDIADGHMVPNTTLQIDDLIEFFAHNSSLFKPNHIFDIDLMSIAPEEELEKIDDLSRYINIKNVLCRLRLLKNPQKTIEAYPQFTVGMVLDPTDSIDTINHSVDLQEIQLIQIMSVEPGFQGGIFIEDTLNKIEQLRMYDYRGHIYLDGGINDKTIEIILSHKELPDALCIGSYLTQAKENLKKRLHHLKEVITI